MISTLKNDWREQGHNWLATGLSVVFGLQLLRLLFVSFVPYLRESVGMGSLELAPVAVGVFALSLLAGVLNRLAGSRNALWISAGGLTIIRVVEQVVSSPAIDLYLAIAGVALFLMWIPLMVGIARTQGGNAAAGFGLAFLLGVVIDNAIFLAGKTLDLSWQSGFIPVGVVLVLAGALLWALQKQTAEAQAASDGNWVVNLALLALGPWLLLQVIVFQSPGMVASLTGWSLPVTGALILAGNAFGLYSAARFVGKPRGQGSALLIGVIITLTLVPGNMAGSGWSWLWLLVGNVFSLRLGLLLFTRMASAPGKPGLLRSTLLAGLGNILFVLLIFVYYASYDISFGLRSALLLIVVSGIMTLFALLAHLGAVGEGQSMSDSPALIAAALLIVPLVLALTWVAPALDGPANPDSIVVMDYNLHNAANTDGRIDPEAIAKLIEAQGADIVGLQEVSRGWLIWGGLDMLSWLSQRLGMDYVWGPTADSQWGNAVLSRYPITGVEFYDLPPEELLLQRGFIVADIDLGDTTLNLIDTHFTHVDEHDQERLIQASAIVDVWNHAPLTVFMGDLNARPDSEAILLLIDAGLVDISRQIGAQPVYTYSSTNPDHQIDYIFVSPDLGYSSFSIPATTASDHLPLVAVIELP